MREDWLLGMSYLFILQKNHIKEVQDILMGLPETDLYTQSGMYYYSLELHKRFYRNIENLYLFKPLSVIWKTINIAHKCKDSDINEILKYWQARLLNDQDIEEPTFFESNQTLEDNYKIEDYEKSEESDTGPTQSSTLTSEVSKKVSTENLTLRIDDQYQMKDNLAESEAKEDVEWTDDWGNFSDEDVADTIANKKNIPENKFRADTNVSLIRDIGNCATEEDRFTAFERVFDKIKTADHFHEIKEVLLRWPKFTKSEYASVDKHPILKMMKLVNVYVPEKYKNNYNKQIFQEYRGLIEALSSEDVSLKRQLHLMI